MSESVKIIKVTGGQEIIAKVVEHTPTELLVQSPLTVQPLRSGESSLAIGLMPFTWGGDSKHAIAINKAHVLCVMDAEDELRTQYLAALSGLTLPGPSTKTPKLTLVE